MSDQFEGMTDSELTEAIFETETGEDSNPVNPAEDFDGQPEKVTEDNDADHSEEAKTDSDNDSTDEVISEDTDQETSTKDDESNEDDTNGEEDNNAEAANETTFQPLKAGGKEYPIDSIDELYKLASAGVGAQQKFQAIAGHRKSILAAEKAGVDLMEAVNFQANFKEDPKGTILRMLKESDIDPMDLDSDDESTPTKDYSVTDFEVNYEEIVGEIGDSPLFKDVQNVLLNEWDEASRNIFFERPEMIKQLHDEMKPLQGLDKSMWELTKPVADKMKLYGDTRSDYDIYMDARSKKVAEFEKFDEAKTKSTKPARDNAKVKSKKSRASITKGKSTNGNTLDFASMSDSELDAFLAKTN